MEAWIKQAMGFLIKREQEMEKLIYKYRFLSKLCTFSMPKEAQILSCQTQEYDEILMWVMFDVENKSNLEIRKFRIVGTGEPFNSNDNWTYIETVQLMHHEGIRVWHIFEID